MRRSTHPDHILRWRLLRVISELERVSEQTVTDARGRLMVDDTSQNSYLLGSAKAMRELCGYSTDKCREYLKEWHELGSGASEGDS